MSRRVPYCKTNPRMRLLASSRSTRLAFARQSVEMALDWRSLTVGEYEKIIECSGRTTVLIKNFLVLIQFCGKGMQDRAIFFLFPFFFLFASSRKYTRFAPMPSALLSVGSTYLVHYLPSFCFSSSLATCLLFRLGTTSLSGTTFALSSPSFHSLICAD